jgi:hypothetical protein
MRGPARAAAIAAVSGTSVAAAAGGGVAADGATAVKTQATARALPIPAVGRAVIQAATHCQAKDRAKLQT